ncbi:MAG TPA: UDP-N-acetylmuramate--L-alanine ligase [Clostridiales bacterium]|jgi:UDP-N-acetylmuramate--alanine ligase|nr:UDP-N-acetylmuramate--L-alanine ligase [Clostridiales bacterium]
MKYIDPRGIRKIHFIGIGGTSMSGLAHIALHKGFQISGSDMRPCTYTERFEKEGYNIAIGHRAENIPDDCDLVVYTAAINSSNPEMIEAARRGLPVMQRKEFLGYLTTLYPTTIAVSGTHGKTSTSSMISMMLLHAGLDPTISVGGTIPDIDSNFRVGSSEYFVTEACEYVDSFLHSVHRIAVILNVEEDHLDYFQDGIQQIRSSFLKFARIVPRDGLLVLNGDDKELSFIKDECDCNVITFGLNQDNDFYAENIKYNSQGLPEFDVIKHGEFYGHFKLIIPGQHNVLNALSAIICGDFLGIPQDKMSHALMSFTGAKRRFELRGEINGIKVFEDYAHHPTEVKITIEACRNYEHRKLWVVFQPHTYSRVHYFFDEFTEALSKCDFLIMNDVYSDREANFWNVSSEMLAQAVTDRYNTPAVCISKFEDIVDFLAERVQPKDLVLVAGSQSINQVAFMLVDKLKEAGLEESAATSIE